MKAKIVTMDPARPEPAFSRCREVVRSGGLIAYPTDTFYALGADPDNSAAVKRILEVKGRQSGQPILLLVRDSREVLRWAEEITPLAERLMKKYWPRTLGFSCSGQGRVSLAKLPGRLRRGEDGAGGGRDRADPSITRLPRHRPHRHEREYLW